MTALIDNDMTYTEMIVLDAFRDAYGRMFTRGGEEWLNDIPRERT